MVKTPGTTLAEGIHTVRGMMAIYQSVRSGKTIYLDDLKLEVSK